MVRTVVLVLGWKHMVFQITFFSWMLPPANGANFLVLSGCSKPP